MRTFPAYGRAFAQLIQRGRSPVAIGVLFSSRWQDYLAAPRVCIRPDEWALGRWEFGFLRAQHVVAIWGDEAEPRAFGELLCELMAAKPRALWVANGGGGFVERTGDPVALEAYARQLGAAGALVQAAARLYSEAEAAAFAERAARSRRALERGVPLPADHFDEIERLFGDPLREPEEHAA